MIQTPWKRKYTEIWYKNMTIEEKRKYHREKMSKSRISKRNYYLKVQRGLLWRYIEENKVFTTYDLNYILQLNK